FRIRLTGDEADSLTCFQSLHLRPQRRYVTPAFMSRRSGFHRVVEPRTTLPHGNVGRAYTATLEPDENLSGARRRYRSPVDARVARSLYPDGSLARRARRR